MPKKPKTFKEFPEIPGETLMDRRIRFWKSRRAQGGHSVMGKEPLKNGNPTNRQIYALVRALAARVSELEKTKGKEA